MTNVHQLHPHRAPAPLVYSAGGRPCGGREFRTETECDAYLARLQFWFQLGALIVGLALLLPIIAVWLP